MPDRQLRVFLCHSSGDKPTVRDLYRRLKADGFAPWLDEEELLPGQDWKEEIPAAVRACDVVIVCLSPKSVNKEGYLQKEIREALSEAEEKPEGTIFIIPVKLEEVEVPKRFSQWQWANLFQEGGYQRLIRALNVRAGAIGVTVATSAARKPGEDERLLPEAGAPPQGSNPVEVAILPPTVPKPQPTLIVSPPPPEVSQPLSSTKVVPPPPSREPIAPMPLPAIAQAKADSAVQAPPHAPPERTVERPSSQPLGGKPALAAILPPALAEPPQLQTISKPPAKMKFVAIAGGALILIVAGVWYFSHQRQKGLNPDGSIKKGAVSSSAKADESKGEVRVNPKDGLKYVWIPPGTFMMGCSPGDNTCTDDEKPPHQVTITKGFWMGQTEVTVGAYTRFAGSKGVQMPPAPDFNAGWKNQDMPIVAVTWDDATAFCGWAGGRLPTEAEWEYAARAGSTEARYGPIAEVAWYSDNSGQKTHEVGQKGANAFGLYDVLGNAWEWVNDWNDGNYYQTSPPQDPPGPASAQGRVLRGGSWDSYAGRVRVSLRGWGNPGKRFSNTGFRCGGRVFVP